MLWRDLQASSEQTQNLTFTQPKNGLEPISFDRSISLCIPPVGPLFPETLPSYHMCVLQALRHALRTARVERRLEGILTFFIPTI
jgi:hypothetical protein